MKVIPQPIQDIIRKLQNTKTVDNKILIDILLNSKISESDLNDYKNQEIVLSS